MREIKFRVFNTEKNRMFEPFTLKIAIDAQNHEPLDETKHFVMQFTGLHDKDGKEIYEHDFVKIKGKVKTPQIVGWDAELGQWCFTYDTGEAMRAWSLGERKLFEVIGNIYENPELLTV
jgi:uncharacterized phage protein (TIGR01671 family)